MAMFAIVLGAIGTTTGISSLAWQVWTWHQARRLELEIEARPYVKPGTSGKEREWDIQLLVRNKSRGFTAYVSRVWVESGNDPRYVEMKCGDDSDGLLVAIEPLGSKLFCAPGESTACALGGFEDAVFQVTTADGSSFRKAAKIADDFVVKALLAAISTDEYGPEDPGILTGDILEEFLARRRMFWMSKGLEELGMVHVSGGPRDWEVSLTEVGVKTYENGFKYSTNLQIDDLLQGKISWPKRARRNRFWAGLRDRAGRPARARDG
jgi:hypothetical protein